MNRVKLIIAMAVLLAAGAGSDAQEPYSIALTDGDSIPPDNVGPLDAPMIPVMPGMGAPMPMPTDKWAVSPRDFNALLTAIRDQTFDSNQLPMIQAAGLCGWFTCEQCAALMNIFDFDENKLKVVAYLAHHLIDPIRWYPIQQSLSFIDSQQKAWRIISQANP